MKCQNLFSEKNKKNISICHLLNKFTCSLSVRVVDDVMLCKN